MNKKVISAAIAGLIGICPLSTYAANDNLNNQTDKLVSIIIQQNRRPDHDPKREEGNKKEEQRREQERREQERREQERREQERREQERRDHERREQQRREDERQGHGRDNERREYERREEQRREQERNDARYIIHRTADVIFVAQRSTGRRHYYKGMAQAVSHQQKARQLYMAGFYQEAIFHSLRAREIAIVIIQGNKEKWSGSWDYREERYRRSGPRGNELDVKLNFIKIGDKEAVRISIDLDL